MITSGILYLIYGFVWAITSPFRFFNDVALPAAFTTAVSTAVSYLGIIGQMFPLTIVSLAGVVVIFLAIEGGIGTFKVVKWVYTKIPGIN